MKYIFFFTLILIIPFGAHANAEIKIGNIQPAGATADDEFIELINQTETAIDLSPWSLQYKSASGTTFYKKNFVKGTSITANGKYIACGPGYAGTCDMKHSSFSLSSSGGTVFLVAGQTLITSTNDEKIIDQKIYTNIPEVNPPPIDNDVVPPTVTPLPKQEPTIPLITINEIMPTPTDGNEWIELYNGSTSAYELNGWTLSDGTEKSFSSLSGLILPTQFLLVEISASRLNNNGDIVILKNAEQKIVDRVSYGDWENNLANAPAPANGVALARLGDGVDSNRDNYDFVLTQTPTPNGKNIISPITSDAPTPNTLTIKNSPKTQPDIKWLTDLLTAQNDELSKLLKAENIIIINNLNISPPVTQPVPKTTESKTATGTIKTATKTTAKKIIPTAEGTIIVASNIVGKDIAVIREDNRSVELRLPPNTTTLPVPGDVVRASGSWSTAKTLTLPRLLIKKATDFTVIDHAEPEAPIAIAITEAKNKLGEVVTLKGTVVQKTSSRLRLEENGATALIKTTFEAQKNDRVSATGLIVKSGEDILMTPLSPESVVINAPPPAPSRGIATRATPYGIAVLPAVALSVAAFLARRMNKRKGVIAND